MFGRIPPVKNGSPVHATEPDEGRSDAVVDDFQIRKCCQEFVDALRTCAAFNVDASSATTLELTIDRGCSEEIAYEKMEHALQELRSLRASSSAGFQAKFEALFALEDWFGKEDFRVVGFAFELLKESFAFIVADESKPVSRMNSRFSDKRQQPRSGFPRLLRFAGEARTRTPGRARRSQS
jgi:hypothetical protein